MIQVARFIAVGCLAALVHWLVVAALVEGLQWHPLVANLGGWLVALCVSFSGHHGFTFRGHGAPMGTTAPRFAAISAAGFLVNEVAYAAMLRWTQQSYQLALGMVLVGVAAGTYLLSRQWAFLRR
ncbi:GtrA family protein [Roseateles amylovorans]|uniref:GtrA family protein n=1 Tax=Roseateles amylovorans TaxID=2978473 RepID=A0ABY6AWN7_9BURK|nr:GtrA family protein [Roseateles amylovorans]UXH76236.1 GtrA family protein [Roseateles amylovorans]